MNNTFQNLLKNSIRYFLNSRYDNNDKYKDNQRYFICKFSKLGFKFTDTNSKGLTDFTIRDNVKNILESNKSLIDKKIYDIIFNKEIIVNEQDLSFYQMIIFALMIKLSKKYGYEIINDELYVY